MVILNRIGTTVNELCSLLAGMATSSCTAQHGRLAWRTWRGVTCSGSMMEAPFYPEDLSCCLPAASSLPSTGTRTYNLEGFQCHKVITLNLASHHLNFSHVASPKFNPFCLNFISHYLSRLQIHSIHYNKPLICRGYRRFKLVNFQLERC